MFPLNMIFKHFVQISYKKDYETKVTSHSGDNIRPDNEESEENTEDVRLYLMQNS